MCSRAQQLRLPHFLLLVVLLNSSIAQLRAQTTLRWKFHDGQRLQLKIRQQATTTTSVNKRPLAISSNMEMTVDWSVERVDREGAATMTQRFSRMAIKFQAPGAEPVQYDSLQDKNPTGQVKRLAERLQPLIGSPFHVTVGNRGQIERVRFGSDLGPSAESSRLKHFVSKERLGEILRQSNLILPESPVAVGDSWETNSDQPSPLGRTRLTTVYTFGGPQLQGMRKLSRIDLTTRLEVQESSQPARRNVARITKHRQSGVIYFDVEAGYLVSSQIRQERTTEKLYRGQRIETVDQSSTALEVVVP